MARLLIWLKSKQNLHFTWHVSSKTSSSGQHRLEHWFHVKAWWQGKLENLRAHSYVACGIDVASVAMSCKGKVRHLRGENTGEYSEAARVLHLKQQTSPGQRRQLETWHFSWDVTAHVQHIVTWHCPEVENVRMWRFTTKTSVLHVFVLILLAYFCAIFVPNQGKVAYWLPLCLKQCSGSIPGRIFS